VKIFLSINEKKINKYYPVWTFIFSVDTLVAMDLEAFN